MSDSLLFPALRKIAAIRIAEFIHSVREEVERLDKDQQPEEAGTPVLHTEIADHYDMTYNNSAPVVAERKVGFSSAKIIREAASKA